MTTEKLIAHREAEIARLQEDRAALTKPGAAIGEYRWGTIGPTSRARQRLAEIDRQIADLRALSEGNPQLRIVLIQAGGRPTNAAANTR